MIEHPTPVSPTPGDVRAEAERRWPSYRTVGFSGAEDRQAAFTAGAEWATQWIGAYPLPTRERIARALRADRTNGLCELGRQCELCDCSPRHEDDLALRDADAVLALHKRLGGDAQ